MSFESSSRWRGLTIDGSDSASRAACGKGVAAGRCGDEAVHLFAPMADDSLTIAIDGVDDPILEAAIYNAIRDVCRVAQIAGNLVVAVAPSDTRGRWDLATKSVAGRHFASFAAPDSRLADVIAEHLARMLRRL